MQCSYIMNHYKTFAFIHFQLKGKKIPYGLIVMYIHLLKVKSGIDDTRYKLTAITIPFGVWFGWVGNFALSDLT